MVSDGVASINVTVGHISLVNRSRMPREVEWMGLHEGGWEVVRRKRNSRGEQSDTIYGRGDFLDNQSAPWLKDGDFRSFSPEGGKVGGNNLHEVGAEVNSCRQVGVLNVAKPTDKELSVCTARVNWGKMTRSILGWARVSLLTIIFWWIG